MKNIYNPYLPSYEYIPDGEPHIFNNRLYIYGSHDRFNGTDYCQNDYVCWSAPVNDLSCWTFHGEIYNRQQHPYHEERMLLFAPDVIQGKDGRYYLYYSMAHSSRLSVAVCNTPAGHYEYLGDVAAPDGHVYGIKSGEYLNFDPAVFMDDDGSIYLYSGFCPKKTEDELGRLMSGAFVCKLRDDMLTMCELPHLLISRDFECPENCGFFEASSMRKINNTYYFIYSARINGLHYATSIYPDRGFTYGGRIHSSSDIGLRGYTIDNPAYPNGNTHGSIIEINGSYYIFDHRYTNNSSYCRQGVAEKITIEKNGHISQAEATSCGLNNAPLPADGTYPAYIACFLKNITLTPDMPKEQQIAKRPYITQDGEDRDSGDNQYITNMVDGCIAGFKYFNYSEPDYNPKYISVNVKGHADGKLLITTDTDYCGMSVNDLTIASDVNVQITSDKWQNIDIPLSALNGVLPLYFIFTGEGSLSIKDFTFVR